MAVSILITLAIGLAAIGLLCLLMGWISYRGLIFYKVHEPAYIEESVLASGEVSPQQLALPWSRDVVASPRGYGISVYSLRGSSDRLAIFHHGIGWNWLGVMRYMEIFRKEGWSLVALDSRGHGATRSSSRGQERPSYGFFEKADLKAVADWATARFPHRRGFVALGESMGAASVLQYAPLDDRLDAVIADSSFTSAAAELDWSLRLRFVPPFLRPLVCRIADSICLRKEGFSLYEASPEAAILETEIPILFVHGLDDRFVPWRMSVIMAETRRRRLPAAKTELFLVPEARHVKSINAAPEEYATRLRSFLDQSLAEQGASP